MTFNFFWIGVAIYIEPRKGREVRINRKNSDRNATYIAE